MSEDAPIYDITSSVRARGLVQIDVDRAATRSQHSLMCGGGGVSLPGLRPFSRRLPGRLAYMAEAVFFHMIEEARTRAQLELTNETKRTHQEHQRNETRSLWLTCCEHELNEHSSRGRAGEADRNNRRSRHYPHASGGEGRRRAQGAALLKEIASLDQRFVEKGHPSVSNKSMRSRRKTISRAADDYVHRKNEY